ncbi:MULTISPECIES: cell division protein SepF [unclassified Jeotgalibaca]|uniref:cell division protein SepF n=1 Tax=unclassified Jeotgalibaca TaxID=2621505 RepID=UPI003FD058AD
MGIKDSFRTFFGLDEEFDTSDCDSHSYEYESEVAHTSSKALNQASGKVIPIGKRPTTQKASIHVIEPRVYSESERIANYLINNESVLLNFRRMEQDQAIKVVDFIAGSIYAIGGDMKQVGEGIFLCTPRDVEIAKIETEEPRDSYYY